LAVEPDGVRVVTPAGEYCGRVLVGADGSKGIVRRRLGWAANGQPSPAPPAGRAQPGNAAGVARVLEVLTPEDPAAAPEYLHGIAVFDFSPLAAGVQGYYWDFPSWAEGGRAFMNRGIYDSRAVPNAPRADLKATLASELARRDRPLETLELHGHPIHWFDPAGPFSRPRVLLAGDAAGVDPLFGEGIGYALAYGRVAARAIERAFASGDFSFRAYRRQILADWLGRDLTLRYVGAKFAYRVMRVPRQARLAGRIAQAVAQFVPWANRRK
jgi:flavin-dependent dehydrogenase